MFNQIQNHQRTLPSVVRRHRVDPSLHLNGQVVRRGDHSHPYQCVDLQCHALQLVSVSPHGRYYRALKIIDYNLSFNLPLVSQAMSGK